MREFFKHCLLNLYVYCGNRQAEKMTEDEIKFLLDALERMSKLYSYIPEDRQKEIINNCLLTDKEYQNINVRTVAKWLELNGKHYFKEVAHEQSEDKDWKPLEGEAREKRIQEYLQAIASTTTAFTSAMDEGHKGSGTRLRENIEKNSPPKLFTFVDGFSCYAGTQLEAEEIYKQVKV